MTDTPKSSSTTSRRERRAAESRKKTEKNDAQEPKRRVARERRFTVPELSTTPLALAGGALGALALGVGVYGQWIRDEPLSYALYLMAGGGAALGAALWLGDAPVYPVRVGDAGVAVERGETARLLWCDVEELSVSGGDLVLRGADLVLRVPIKAHGAAAAHILREAEKRRPKLVRLTSDEANEARRWQGAKLGEAGASALPKRAPVEAIQITGRACKASRTAITLEADARLCQSCSQVYHRRHVPAVCATCKEPIQGRGLRLE
ncbi:MAG: hypothetical protein KIT72_01145 [Polyangiaceae bacterium]|nr:hypothetical protein [Polyangiaceae bacterium]MCW5789001.1 hypothetical protein [Polyangiaceae bacterium]